MLGRLKMSVEQCEQAYEAVSKSIFGKKIGKIITTPERAFMAGSYLYEALPLEEAVRELVVRYLPGASGDTKLQEPDHLPETDRCKVYVSETTRARCDKY